jgi:hypothetical protein
MWEFPTSTCESLVWGGQPWSALANLMILAMLLTRKRTLLVGSIIWFELIHLYCHITQATGLTLLQHFSVYPILLNYLRVPHSAYSVILLDVFVALRVGGIWQLFTGIMVLLSCHPPDKKVVYGALVVMVLLVNEYLNCEKMVAWFDFPYHVLLELSGMYTFYHMSST